MTIIEHTRGTEMARSKGKISLTSSCSPESTPASSSLLGGNKSWWCDCRNVSDAELLRAVHDSCCTHVVVHPGERVTSSGRKPAIVWLEHEEALDSLGSDVAILTPIEQICDKAKMQGREAGLYVKVKDLAAEFTRCVELCERGDPYIVIDIEHATYIPYELLIAKVQQGRTKVFRSVPINGLEGVVQRTDQSLNALATMEHGIGVLFRLFSAETVTDLSRRVLERQGKTLPLIGVEVCSVRHTDLGHRVCVDTSSLMSAEEGMIVGSTGWGGIFVCSETHYLPHMNLREFRVNAGAVHSYIWANANTTMYLSEMQAGSEVMCVDIHGNGRTVTVGRAKIERRPLISITCRVRTDKVQQQVRLAAQAHKAMQERVTPGGERLSDKDLDYIYLNVFLQNDWHVRVMGSDGKIRHSTMVGPGDELMAHVDYPGRHTGIRVTESIIEK